MSCSTSTLLHRLPDCPHARTPAGGNPVQKSVWTLSPARHCASPPTPTTRLTEASSVPSHRPDINRGEEREMRMIMTERLASLGQMASGIAHEINNPLESVMICAEMRYRAWPGQLRPGTVREVPQDH